MGDCANVEVRDLLPELLHDRLGASEREGGEEAGKGVLRVLPGQAPVGDDLGTLGHAVSAGWGRAA
jgi:hypothetical protein